MLSEEIFFSGPDGELLKDDQLNPSMPACMLDTRLPACMLHMRLPQDPFSNALSIDNSHSLSILLLDPDFIVFSNDVVMSSV